MKTILIAAVAILFAGCTAVDYKMAATVPAPTGEQTQAAVTQYINSTFKDPSSIQNLQIGTPYFGLNGLHTIGGNTINEWIIPFVCNARNSFGGYTGQQVHNICWNGGIDWRAEGTLSPGDVSP
jgi:hypothetical protein